MLQQGIYDMDAIDLLGALGESSVDMIFADLPYGVLACPWDTIIPLDDLWAAIEHAIKPRGAIVMTATQPFTSRLVSSNYELFKYALVWRKRRTTDFIRAKLKPLNKHEDILIFSPGTVANGSDRTMTYNPQMWESTPYTKKMVTSNTDNDSIVGKRPSHDDFVGTIIKNDGERYPVSVLEIDHNNSGLLHPTQKPVELIAYLIRTYSNPGDLVVDPVAGSGTTAVACIQTGRRYICGDNGANHKTGERWADIARRRVQTEDPFQHTENEDGSKQLSLFDSEHV